ncbi:unnamed protein product, partial [Ectocarpus sp. 4 AP-2014]
SRYVYYATQWGQECWCQDETIDLRHGEGTCDYACTGDDSVLCGGILSFSLYELEEAVLPTSPPDDNYVGCFADDRQDRVLGAQTFSSEMTSEACATYCANESSGNKFYATQYGEECWCAPSVNLRHGESTCDYACTGAAETTCGGFEAFDLFELDEVDRSSPPSEDYYLGCFADDQNDRVLADETSSGDMSLQVCEDYCNARDKKFFALQWGQECWCGGCELLDEGLHRYDRHGVTSCTGYPCTGEGSRACGGSFAFSLYYRGTCGEQREHRSSETAAPTGLLTTSDTPTAAPTATPTASLTTGKRFHVGILSGTRLRDRSEESRKGNSTACHGFNSATIEERCGGSIGGDPHVEGYDDVGYDCHGQGEFVVTKAAATDSEVQARFQQLSQNPNPGVTVATAVAAREGSSSVIQATSTASGGLEVWVDGELYDEAAGTAVNGVALELLEARVEMIFPSGLEVTVLSTTGGILRVDAYVPLDLATAGLLGNNNGNIGDDWRTANDEIVEFASARPTVAEGTNYCTTNWCTTEDSSIFTYAEGEDHGTYDLCDVVYVAPVLPDVIPAAVTELCGDNANCVFDALLAGEEVGQATLEEEEAARVYQEGLGGLCTTNTFSSTGTPPCTDCPAGEVSGRGAKVCVPQGVPTVALPSEAIVAAMLADVMMGGFGVTEVDMQPWGEIELTDANLGSVYVSGKFVRHDSAALPFSSAVFFYIENADQPDDFARGSFKIRGASGDFSMVVMDVPPGNSRLFLSFVIEDPADALNVAAEVVPATSIFSLDISNMGCVPSLTITHEWFGGNFAPYEITEPDLTTIHSGRGDGVGVFQDNWAGSSPAAERYILYSGLDVDTSQVLGEYKGRKFLPFLVPSETPPTWRITARVSGEIVYMYKEERVQSDIVEFTVLLTDYDPSCGVPP